MTSDAQRRWDDTGQPAMTVREMVLCHDADIEALKAWRSRLEGAWKLVVITLGASLVSGILAVIAIASLITGALK